MRVRHAGIAVTYIPSQAWGLVSGYLHVDARG